MGGEGSLLIQDEKMETLLSNFSKRTHVVEPGLKCKLTNAKGQQRDRCVTVNGEMGRCVAGDMGWCLDGEMGQCEWKDGSVLIERRVSMWMETWVGVWIERRVSVWMETWVQCVDGDMGQCRWRDGSVCGWKDGSVCGWRDRSVCPWRDGSLFKSHFDPQNPIKKPYEVAPICNPSTPMVAVGDLA